MQENENREFQRLKIPLGVDAVIGEKIVQSQILDTVVLSNTSHVLVPIGLKSISKLLPLSGSQVFS